MNWYKKAQIIGTKSNIVPTPIDEISTTTSHLGGWLDPNGNFYSLSDYGHTPFLREKLGLTYEKLPSNEELYKLAHVLGWIRLREYEYKGGYIEAQGTRSAINHNLYTLKQISDAVDGKLEYHFV